MAISCRLEIVLRVKSLIALTSEMVAGSTTVLETLDYNYNKTLFGYQTKIMSPGHTIHICKCGD